jgi:hypothetical protein
MRIAVFQAIAILCTSFEGSAASAAGDPDAGEKLVKEHCVRCHDISPSGAFKTYPPSFASIAVYWSDEQIYARNLVSGAAFRDLADARIRPEFLHRLEEHQRFSRLHQIFGEVGGGERGVGLQHLAILIGRHAQAEVCPEILQWLEAHR